MNVHLILGMAEPYVKDGSITYDQFENIYSMLSLREKYDVTEILYKNGIDLVAEEERTDKDDFILEAEIDEDDFDEDVEGVQDSFSVLYDTALFKDSNYNPDIPETLVVNRNVKQSNEILCTLIQQGNLQAMQDLCVKNQRLVDKYAAAYSKKYRHHLDFEDLKQVGFMGLIKAAQKFDIKLGYSFSTYAVWWIKQAISREIMDNGFAIRIPVHMMERINKIAAMENKFTDCIHEECIQKIADEMGMSEEAVRECMILKTNILTYSSLNASVGEEEDSELGDFIPSKDVQSVEDIVTSRELRRCLDEVLETLKDRERQVLRMRFGLDDGKPRTLEYVGQKFGVTRERIRQIEAKALRKMRHPTKSKKLKGFL
ncbi:MAG: sigma-70 family RNA polymerase sigma factor [Lachnospiraceae bacterium]